MPEETTNALDAGLTALGSDEDVLYGFEPMYNPFDRPPDEEVVEVIPRT